jgi:type IV pilus assembly protein PilE
MSKSRGFTLIELMIAIAILALISAFAIPAYNNYIRESRLGAMRMNLETLRIAVEGFRLDNAVWNNYGNATYTGVTAISAQYGWKPDGSSGGYAYTVRATSAATPTFCLLASGNNLWVRCIKGNTPFCTDGTGSGSCP